MNLSEVKTALEQVDAIVFQLPDGEFVPAHFHVTEIGKINKQFIDCGRVLRKEEKINFQLWSSEDVEHRLSPEKLRRIIDLSEEKLKAGEGEIEVEYQGKTIEKYSLDFNGEYFLLTTQHTGCLAKVDCGIPAKKQKVGLSELKNSNCCEPNSGCC